MAEALALVKRELGPEAVILGTRTIPPGAVGALLGQSRVEIHAAPPDCGFSPPRLAPRSADPSSRRATATARRAAALDQHAVARARQPGTPPSGRVTGRDEIRPPAAASPAAGLPESLHAFYTRLVQNDVAEQLATQIIQQAAARCGRRRSDPEMLQAALRETVAAMIPAGGEIELSEAGVRRVAVIGPPGGGKTTTLAKLAARFAVARRRRVALLSLDMHRLATHAELKRYGELIGVPTFTAQSVGAVKQALRQTAEHELLLIDTPGVGPRDRGRFARLAALLRAARADEVHLVLPATLQPAVQERCVADFAPLGGSRIVLTRLDELVGAGVVLNLIHKLRWSVSYLTDGQSVPRSIHEACGRRLAELIFPLAR